MNYFIRVFGKVPHALLLDIIAVTIPIHKKSLYTGCKTTYLDDHSGSSQGIISLKCVFFRQGLVKGCYLSLVLFNICSNSLLKKLKGIAAAYADDIKPSA